MNLSRDESEAWCLRYIARSNADYASRLGITVRPNRLCWLIVGRMDRMYEVRSPFNRDNTTVYTVTPHLVKTGKLSHRSIDLVVSWARVEIDTHRHPMSIVNDNGLAFTSAFPEREAFWDTHPVVDTEFVYRYAAYKGVELSERENE
jgi:hypothetical protein